MASIAKFDTWQNSAGVTRSTVLQTLQVVKTDTASTSSQSFIDIPGMSVTITPTSITNKILVIMAFNGLGRDHASIKLLRNGTEIGMGDASGSATRAFGHFGPSGSYRPWDIESRHNTYLDSPGTTSAVTYKLQWAVPWASSYAIYINRGVNDDTNSYTGRTSSSLTVMEIAQ